MAATIAGRGTAFASGGSTTGNSPVVEADTSSDMSQLLGLMQQLVHSQQGLCNELTEWKRDLDVNLDPRKAKKAIDTATQMMSGGGIR